MRTVRSIQSNLNGHMNLDTFRMKTSWENPCRFDDLNKSFLFWSQKYTWSLTALWCLYAIKNTLSFGKCDTMVDIGIPDRKLLSRPKVSWHFTWWRHQMETFSALLALCAGNSPVPGEFPTQRPVTRGFDVYFDLRPNKRLSKQSLGWWFETLSPTLWRHRNAPLESWCEIYLITLSHFTGTLSEPR